MPPQMKLTVYCNGLGHHNTSRSVLVLWYPNPLQYTVSKHHITHKFHQSMYLQHSCHSFRPSHISPVDDLAFAIAQVSKAMSCTLLLVLF